MNNCMIIFSRVLQLEHSMCFQNAHQRHFLLTDPEIACFWDCFENIVVIKLLDLKWQWINKGNFSRMILREHTPETQNSHQGAFQVKICLDNDLMDMLTRYDGNINIGCSLTVDNWQFFSLTGTIEKSHRIPNWPPGGISGRETLR